mgnify:CR=1 FL=1
MAILRFNSKYYSIQFISMKLLIMVYICYCIRYNDYINNHKRMVNVMEEKMTEKEFEEYWKANRESILSKDEEYRRAKDNFKMSNGSDMLLFGLPIVAGIVFMNKIGRAHV